MALPTKGHDFGPGIADIIRQNSIRFQAAHVQKIIEIMATKSKDSMFSLE